MTADIQAAKGRLTLDLIEIEERINAFIVRFEPDCDNWSVRYLGDTARDARTLIAAFAEARRQIAERDEALKKLAGELDEAAIGDHAKASGQDCTSGSSTAAFTGYKFSALAYESASKKVRALLAPPPTGVAETFSPEAKRQAWSLIEDAVASTNGGAEPKPVTMLVDQDWLSRHVATDQDASVEAGPDVLVWLSANRNVELSFDYGDADDDGKGWCVHRVNGGINDREWTLIGAGETPLAALRAALASQHGGGDA